jgi:hypothetical protein
MGVSSSVHVSNDTFLTAYDFETEADGWGIPEESESEGKSEGGKESDDFIDLDKSVATEDYNPPPNQFYAYTDFEAVKQRHFDMKEKYVEYLHNYMTKDVSSSIEHAKFISAKKLKPSGGHDQNHRFIIDPFILADMVST